MEEDRSGPFLTGTIHSVSPVKNFGFIRPDNADDDSQNVYYYKDCCPEAKPGDRVRFEVLIRKFDGTTRFSKNVEFISANGTHEASSPRPSARDDSIG